MKLMPLYSIGYLILYFHVFFTICKKNKSLFNSYTVDSANEILIRYIPFILNIGIYVSNYHEAIILFFIILYSSTLSKFIGYMLGSKISLRYKIIDEQLPYKKYKYKNLRKLCFIVGIIAFIFLGLNGVGVKEWIINPRNAYMHGRSGNGIYYVLFQLSIIISAILFLCDLYYKREKKYRYIFWIIISYFTGSKMQILGIILIYFFYKDIFVRKINIKKTIIICVFGLVAVMALMFIQSNITLLNYSDYYFNFIRLLDYSLNEKWTFFTGKISLENVIWGLIPRALYPDKPYIYGYSKIINIFYPEKVILDGNTPSFSQFCLVYVDFGVIGVCITFFLKGILYGFLENYLRKRLKNKGMSFNVFFTYCICFIVSPLNFGIIYFFIFYLVMHYIQAHWRGVKGLKFNL